MHRYYPPRAQALASGHGRELRAQAASWRRARRARGTSAGVPGGSRSPARGPLRAAIIPPTPAWEQRAAAVAVRETARGQVRAGRAA